MSVWHFEPIVHPADLLQKPLPGRGAAWWLLRLRPQAEKTLARQLYDRCVGFFLPLYCRRKRCGGRWRSTDQPLFPDCLFLYGDWLARLIALESNLVAHCQAVAEQARLHGELARLHRLLTSGLSVEPEGRPAGGHRTRVVAGPLAGLEGVLVEQAAGRRLIVEVTCLGRGASAAVEAWMLRPAAVQVS
jgi:transcriptional antiterminator RfaH